MSKPDDVSQEVSRMAVAAVLAAPLTVLRNTDTIDCVARAITAAVAAEREACAVLADEIGAGRARQKIEATVAKKRTEARDFESMAMSAINVGYAIRARSTQ